MKLRLANSCASLANWNGKASEPGSAAQFDLGGPKGDQTHAIHASHDVLCVI